MIALWHRFTQWLDADVDEASILATKYQMSYTLALQMIRRWRRHDLKSGQHPSSS